jgi:hypothetical protein
LRQLLLALLSLELLAVLSVELFAVLPAELLLAVLSAELLAVLPVELLLAVLSVELLLSLPLVRQLLLVLRLLEPLPPSALMPAVCVAERSLLLPPRGGGGFSLSVLILSLP